MRISDYEFNRLQVLKAIRRSEPVARTDLVGLTGLAGGTITQLTADFVRRGVVIEEKAATGGLGRPRMGLRINATGGHVLSVFTASHDSVAIEIVNLRGDPVFTREVPIKRDATLELRARQLAAIIDETITASPFSRKDISRVGIVIHGVVDNVRGVVHWLATFPDRGVPFATLVEKRLQIPVVIDNDANVIARAEHWFGEENQLDDFSLIIVDHGVTSAHYVDGMLWTGAHGINPELGHTKISLGEARPCYCGATGCLATYGAIFGIVSRICELRKAENPPLQNLVEVFRQFADEARNGVPDAREVFDLAGRMLGTAAANMLNERDPARIIVMAFQPEMIPAIAESFSAALTANSLPAVSGRGNIQFKLIDVDHYRKGSAALALEQIYRG